MANKYNTDIQSQIIDLQYKYLIDHMTAKLKDQYSSEQISAIVAETMKRYYVNIGRPLTLIRDADPDHLPFVEDYNDTMSEITEDTNILYKELELIGKSLSDNFNYIQTEHQRIHNRIKAIGSLTNDLNLLANEVTPNSTYFRDSFNDESKVEARMTTGIPAQISTREGIVTLARSNTTNQSKDASIKLIQGNGHAGTEHVVRKIITPVTVSNFTVSAAYLSEQTPNNDSQSILDGRPDTIFEYSMANIPSTDILGVCKGYDVEWCKGSKDNGLLRLKLIIELKISADINWININPYTPEGSTGKVTVYSIRTSEDGFDYKPLYNNGSFILNAEINTTPQTYRQDEVFDGKNDYSVSKFAGQGVWSFPTRKAKYVEFVLDQASSYAELIGHTYYATTTISKDAAGKTQETSVRVPITSVPDTVAKAAPGRYLIKDNQYIDKGIDILNGWRYVIGIRDINIMSYEFTEKSELVSKRFTVDKPIKEVMLYVNEKIPEQFLSDLKTANDWIQYYFSLDDVTWYQISANHQQPTNGQVFPPKIYAINESNIDLQSSFHLYKGYVETNTPATGIRFKAVLQRPTIKDTNAQSFTPILEDYALRVVFEEGK